MQLNVIKNKIRKNDNILKIATSLKVMCSIRLRQLKIQKDSLDQHVTNIETKILNNNCDTNQNKEIKKTNLKTKIIHLILFTDMSFCGNFNKNNISIITHNLHKDDMVFIIGIKGEKYSKTIDYNRIFIDKLYSKNLIDKLYNNILGQMQNTQIHIKLYNQELKPINISYNQFIITNPLDALTNKVHLKYLLAKYLTHFKYEECRTRLMKVTTAINNSSILQQTLKTIYNKTRQGIITRDLLEVISGSQINEEGI